MRIKITEPGTLLSVLLDAEITQDQYVQIRQIVDGSAGQTLFGRGTDGAVHREAAPVAVTVGLVRLTVAEGSYDSVGALGLPFAETGEVIQAMGRDLIDRGHTREEVIAALADFDEVAWWGYGGMSGMLDALEELLFRGEAVVAE